MSDYIPTFGIIHTNELLALQMISSLLLFASVSEHPSGALQSGINHLE